MVQTAEQPGAGLIRILVSLGLDYIRWTQFVPMIMAWAFLLVMVGAMLLVNFQQQSFDLLESGVGAYERVFGASDDAIDALTDHSDRTLADGRTERIREDSAKRSVEPSPAEAVNDSNGAVRFTGDDLKPWALRVWAIAALAGWVLGLAWRSLFGAPPRLSLKHKLLITAATGSACTLLFLCAYFFGSERFNGGFAGWLALFIGAPLVVWCVSAWSLTVSAAITWLQERIREPERAP